MNQTVDFLPTDGKLQVVIPMMATNTLQQPPTQRSAMPFQSEAEHGLGTPVISGYTAHQNRYMSSQANRLTNRMSSSIEVSKGIDLPTGIVAFGSHQIERQSVGQAPITLPHHGWASPKDEEWNEDLRSSSHTPSGPRRRVFYIAGPFDSRLDRWVSRTMQWSTTFRVKLRIMWNDRRFRYPGFKRMLMGLILFIVIVHMVSRAGDRAASGDEMRSDENHTGASTSDKDRRIHAPLPGFEGEPERRSRPRPQANASKRRAAGTPGLVTIEDDTQEHPIKTLMTTAQQEWENKNSRQSRTLREAVTEYQKRYERAPPKGFNKWWHYAKYAILISRMIMTGV